MNTGIQEFKNLKYCLFKIPKFVYVKITIRGLAQMARVGTVKTGQVALDHKILLAISQKNNLCNTYSGISSDG